MVITIYLITGHVDEQLLLQWKIYIFFWAVLNLCPQLYWWTTPGRPGENHKPAASHSNFMLLYRVHFALDMNRTHIY
jgi:cyanate permease